MKFKRIIVMLIIATLILANGKYHVQASENSVKVNVVSVNNKNKNKKAFDEKLKKNKRYMIKFKISGKNKKIKFKL